MKIKNLLLSLTLAGTCLTHGADQAFPQSATKHIGDSTDSSYVSDASDQRPPEFRSNAASLSSALDMSVVAPTAFSTASCDTSCSSGCDSSCEGGCDSACGGAAAGLLGGVLGDTVGSGWFSVESLLWFSEQERTPALIATAPGGVFPVLGSATGTYSDVSRGMMPGLRAEGGVFVDEDQKFGFGGRAYGIFQDADEYQVASNGSTSIGIPFFNINPAVTAEDAYLVAYTSPANVPVSVGEAWARSDLDMFGAEGSLRALLGRGKNHRFDLIAGYTYSKIKNSVGLRTQSTNLFTGDLIPDGTIFTTDEFIATENEFNGGHVGLMGSVSRKRLNIQTLTKVSFGNMRQRYLASGYTIEEFGAVSTATEGGIFTNASNIGSFEQDVFAFIPELGVKLGFQANDNVQATVGYTCMMWSSVGLAGDQVQRHLDSTGTFASPIRGFQESSFWMQGLDLGLTLTY